MRGALYLARTGLARTQDNPSVGCVIVQKGIVVGRARTANGGRPHAEPQAIAQAGDAACGATMYVTLEPCSHHGKTPPCVDAVIAAKPARVVVGMSDPDKRVSGRGVQALRDAGIDVVCGCLEDDIRNFYAGFTLNRMENRPFVTLKIASSMDGKIATESGQSQWITGELARRYGHLERAQHDAIIVGRGTVEKDNPSLTARLNGIKNDPIRIVFDTKLNVSADCEVVKTAQSTDSWIVCGTGADQKRKDALLSTGVDIMECKNDNNGLPMISTALSGFSERGLQRVLVEGGPLLITSFLRAGFCDRILWFRSSSIIGNEGLSGVADMGVSELVDKAEFIHNYRRKLGNDILDVYTG